jgi:DNA mismatch endonuclease Vsr
MERSLRETLPLGEFGVVPISHSERMRAIKAKGNRSTERRARAILVRSGIRGWRMHALELPGKPDFLFPDSRVVVFVDGCYWHGCPRCSHVSRVNRAYWSAKIGGNRRRDKRTGARLRREGYRVLRIWEHELGAGCGGGWVQRLRNLVEGTRKSGNARNGN